MLSWSIPLQSVVYRSLHELRRIVPAYCILCFLILVISGFVVKYLHSKVYQQKATKTVQTLSCITYLRVMISSQKYANISFLQLIFGTCSLFSKEGMYGIILGPVKYVFLYSLEAVEFLLGSRTILHKGAEYDIFKSVFRDGLFMTNGKKWYTRRKQLAPSFHFKILDGFFFTFNKQANILVERIDAVMKTETNVDVLHLVGLCSLDIILETVLGVSVNEVESQRIEFFYAIRRADAILSKRISLPWFWSDFIFSKTQEAKILENCKDIFKKFAIEVIENRKRHMRERQDVNKSNDVNQSNCDTIGETKRFPPLELMLNLHLQDNSVPYEELIDHVVNFMAAGHDTTSLVVSWTLYLLGLHQDIQRNIQQEVDSVLGDDINRMVISEDVKSLTYLQCVLKESMRLYPPTGILSRLVEEDTIINGYQIGKGTTLVLPVYVIHRNPEVFPNPEKFIPERFNKENCTNIHPFAYIPFSAGPRNCTGQRFATYNATTILSTVLRHFSVEALEHRDKTGISFNLLMIPQNAIRLKFTRRQF